MSDDGLVECQEIKSIIIQNNESALLIDFNLILITMEETGPLFR